ncbi:MAG: TlpA disulfide reductase family protein [Enterobacterales bacterium]|nr:TlpA disulfide reductase family protein [Enterobacterales bacterium]
MRFRTTCSIRNPFVLMLSFVFRLIIIFALSNAVIASEKIKPTQLDNFDISQYKGKVVYLDFWASWCIPCRKSFPWMNQMHNKYADKNLVIIAVNLDKKQILAEKFLEQTPANFKIIYDPKGQLAKKYKIKGMPSSIIFNSSGEIVVAHTGFFVKKTLQYEKQLQSLL